MHVIVSGTLDCTATWRLGFIFTSSSTGLRAFLGLLDFVGFFGDRVRRRGRERLRERERRDILRERSGDRDLRAFLRGERLRDFRRRLSGDFLNRGLVYFIGTLLRRSSKYWSGFELRALLGFNFSVLVGRGGEGCMAIGTRFSGIRLGRCFWSRL